MCPRNAEIILGINSAYHESSACLIRDGHIVAAVEEERFTGKKHGKEVRVDNADEIPNHAVQYCMREGGVSWEELSAVAFSIDPELRRELACIGLEPPPERFGHPVGELQFYRSLQRAKSFFDTKTSAPFFFVPHHLAHAYYALGTSPFDHAAILVVDGIGEGATLSLGTGSRSGIEFFHQDIFPASIGLAWEKVARFIGLTEYDACKVMALAAFADAPPQNLLVPHLRWHNGKLLVNDHVFRLEFPDDFAGLNQVFGSSERFSCLSLRGAARISQEMQVAMEYLLLNVARYLHEMTGETALAYGGGVALNCRANARLAESGIFSSIHAGPASHDAGTALGAAWHTHCSLAGGGIPLQDPKVVAYSGPAPRDFLQITDGTIPFFRMENDFPLSNVVELLLSGELVGWLADRCEFGPRALGGRSLLGAPHVLDVINRVNRTKGRYWFEPLAVSIRQEDVNSWFDVPPAAAHLVSYMLTTVHPLCRWADRLAHLSHVDGSIRLHVVDAQTAPRFHELLSLFASVSELPFLINTSLNPRGYPMPAFEWQALKSTQTLPIPCLVVDGNPFFRRDLAYEDGSRHAIGTSFGISGVSTHVANSCAVEAERNPLWGLAETD